jgi:hypothetical protein
MYILYDVVQEEDMVNVKTENKSLPDLIPSLTSMVVNCKKNGTHSLPFQLEAARERDKKLDNKVWEIFLNQK